MRALILVDIQNDFLPGGSLAVPDGDKVIPVVNRIQPMFDLVVATQDWHPANHGSFAKNHAGKRPGDVVELSGLSQILWPLHCVQESVGAEFASELEMTRVAKVIPKGTNVSIDSYSGFFDNGHYQETGLGDYLTSQHVTDVYVVGLATDYCVKFTALDARQLGFDTYVIEDACRGVNLATVDVEIALSELRDAGVHIIQSTDLVPSPVSQTV